jgi:hypothetical protein
MPYKRLLPSQLSRLSPGDEIIVVVPSPNELNSDVVESATLAFNKVILHGCPRMNAKQQDEHLSHVMKQHEITRNGVVVHEFCVRILNFPELATLDNHFSDTRVIDKLWDQGAGYYAGVCGYSAGAKVLLKLSWLPHLELFKVADSKSFLNDEITYPTSNTNADRLASTLRT